MSGCGHIPQVHLQNLYQAGLGSLLKSAHSCYRCMHFQYNETTECSAITEIQMACRDWNGLASSNHSAGV